MTHREKTAKLIKEKSQFLSSEFGVERIGLFGSFAKGIDKEDSDVDIIVELNRPIGFKFVELVEYFENLTGRKVDVITKDGLENTRISKVCDDIKRSILYV